MIRLLADGLAGATTTPSAPPRDGGLKIADAPAKSSRAGPSPTPDNFEKKT